MATRKFMSRKTKKNNVRTQRGGSPGLGSRRSRPSRSSRPSGTPDATPLSSLPRMHFARKAIVQSTHGVPFTSPGPKGAISAMRNIIDSAGQLKASGTKQFTNSTGRTRTSYDPEAIKKVLSTKGYANNVKDYLAKTVSNQGISATANKLGVSGYKRSYSQNQALEIQKATNPVKALETARARARAAINKFTKATFANSVNPNFGIGARGS